MVRLASLLTLVVCVQSRAHSDSDVVASAVGSHCDVRVQLDFIVFLARLGEFPSRQANNSLACVCVCVCFGQ